MARPGHRLRLPAWLHFHPRRLARVPTVAAATGVDATHARVVIDGMVCGVCAARTRSALRSVDGVRDARVDLAAGTAELDLAAGASPDAAALQRALDGVVVAKWARRWLARRDARHGMSDARGDR
jgi:copper chaperone CopZ